MADPTGWTPEELSALGVLVDDAIAWLKAFEDGAMNLLPTWLAEKLKSMALDPAAAKLVIIAAAFTPAAIATLVADAERDLLAALVAGHGPAKNQPIGMG